VRLRLALITAAFALGATACGTDASSPADVSSPASTDPLDRFGPSPIVPDGPLDPSVAADLDRVFDSIPTGIDTDALARLGGSSDARVAWLLSDILRFIRPGTNESETTVRAWEAVTGTAADGDGSDWGNTTDHLIAWDTPAPPGYVEWKRQLFELVEPGWIPFFEDVEADIDWRLVSWGGVLIDDRPVDRTDVGCPQGCIPALNDPALTDAEGGDWYADDAIVFGLEVDGEAVAFPKNIMEVHEMVNMTVAGRRIGMPYCTLCGSAQAYFTDEIAEGVDLGEHHTYELRTSGLLTRSNKVMYELHTQSVLDTFTGRAVSGPLRELGVELQAVTVRTATWGDWKQAHPDTGIVAKDGGIGRSYAPDPLGGRDDNGPIFPIGDVDARLPVQEPIVGVITPGGPAAFRVGALEAALADTGDTISFGGVTIATDGAGYTATGLDGQPLAAHQAFWFAWSQFHPDTALWDGGG
jgi:hypothetical protein